MGTYLVWGRVEDQGSRPPQMQSHGSGVAMEIEGYICKLISDLALVKGRLKDGRRWTVEGGQLHWEMKNIHSKGDC
jgi:hypothetical protein